MSNNHQTVAVSAFINLALLVATFAVGMGTAKFMGWM